MLNLNWRTMLLCLIALIIFSCTVNCIPVVPREGVGRGWKQPRRRVRRCSPTGHRARSALGSGTACNKTTRVAANTALNTKMRVDLKSEWNFLCHWATQDEVKGIFVRVSSTWTQICRSRPRAPTTYFDYFDHFRWFQTKTSSIQFFSHQFFYRFGPLHLIGRHFYK